RRRGAGGTGGGGGRGGDFDIAPGRARFRGSDRREPRRWLRAEAEAVGACDPADRRWPEARRPARRRPLSILTPAAIARDRPRLGGTEWWRGCGAGTGRELDMQGGPVAARAEGRAGPAEGRG